MAPVSTDGMLVGTSQGHGNESLEAQLQQQQLCQQRQQKAHLSIDASSAAEENRLLTRGANGEGVSSACMSQSDNDHPMESLHRNVVASVALPSFQSVLHPTAEPAGESATLLMATSSQSTLASASLNQNAAYVSGGPAAPASAGAPWTHSTYQRRYNCAAVKAEIENLLADEVPKIGAWASLCSCGVDPKLRSLNSVSLVEQTMSLFKLATYALLATGSSCRERSKAYTEALVQLQPADFPLSLPQPPPPPDFFEQCRSPTTSSPVSRRMGSLRIPIHHLLHHLSLPPHSHTQSLAVLGFCYEFGLTDDVVDVPVGLLTGLFGALAAVAGKTDPASVTTRAMAGNSQPDFAVSASCSRSPLSVPPSPSTPRSLPSLSKSPLSPTTQALTSAIRKAEICYIAASYFPSLFATRRKQPLAPLGRMRNQITFPLHAPLAPPKTPLPPAPAHPNTLALSRLAFLRKYGRPGVRIDQSEAEELVEIMHNTCMQLEIEAATSVGSGLTSVKELCGNDASADRNSNFKWHTAIPEGPGSVAADLAKMCCVTVAGDDVMMSLDDQDTAITSRRKRVDRGEHDENARRRRVPRTDKTSFVEHPTTRFDCSNQQHEPSPVFHISQTDGLAWLKVAAMHYAHPAAQYALGVCYHDGLGVTTCAERAFTWYHLSAHGGDPHGMAILGYCYGEGFGTEKDANMAFKWYRLASLHNESVAIYNIGYCYEDGIGVEKNPSEAIKWYRASAELRNAFAQNSLGYCYEDGIGVEKDEVEAARWYALSAEQGYPWAECNLGYCYQNGIGVRKDEAMGAMWYAKAAMQGHARAQHNLGYCYQNGIGIRQDERQAVYWYMSSATQDNIFALHSLGYCYQNGIGVPVKEEMAVAWYKKAADQGHAPAQLSLGYCYRNGTGVPASDELALKYFTLSAEQGNALGQNSLGFCYEQGLGVGKNPELAAYWYLKSAEQGNPWAQCNIGYCYVHGYGVEQSAEKAAEWYEKAAHQDHARAQCKLGVCYEFGSGVQQDLGYAVYWYRRAAERHVHVGAMFHLARCLEEGIGCEVDLEEALHFYQEAGKAGCVESQKRITRILSTWCLADLSFQFGYCAPCA